MRVPSGLKKAGRSVGIDRARVARLRARCERSVLASMPRSQATDKGRILCYHSVGTPAWGINDVPAARFREQMELALALGYTFVPAGVIAAGLGSPGDLAVTFDDGLMSVATNAAPILSELAIPWTVFIVTGWTGGDHRFGEGVVMGWSEVVRLADAGVEIGSHSLSHPDFGSIPGHTALDELVRSRWQIEHWTGRRTTSFAIPLGQSRNWNATAAACAAEAGYELVYAQAVRSRPDGTVPRTFITAVDDRRVFRAALEGSFDAWEEWV